MTASKKLDRRSARSPGPRGRRGAGRLAVIALLVAAPAFLAARDSAGAQPVHEYQVKAAFLHGFARFVEWPAEAFSSPEDPIVIGVAGEDPFGETLDRAVAGRTAQGRRFVVRRFRRAEQLGFCHILFVGAAENGWDWRAAQRERQGYGTLTVGEGAESLRTGSIAFVLEGRRIQLMVNLEAASEARLRISSRLLALARIWPTGREGSR